MLKKIVSLLLIIAVLTVGLCACGDDSVAMVMAINSDPKCLDPQIVETDTGRLIVANCFEGLVRLNENFGIVPGVAESWEISADGLTYTFHLRDDSKWQLLKAYADVLPDEDYMENFDNRVTAYDFEFGLRRALDPITKCDDAEKFYCIKNAMKVNLGEAEVSSLGVKAVDDVTLTITLERKNDDFIRLLTLAPAMPCSEEFFKETHAKYGLGVAYTFCNGPFYVSKWVEDNSVVIRKSEVYKGKNAVTVDAVYFNINKDENSVATKVKQGDYSCAYVTDTIRAGLADAKNIQYVNCSNKVSGLCFNCADAVLANADIRKALAMLTEFDKISVPANASGTAGGIVPDSCRFGEKSYREAAGKAAGISYNETLAKTHWNEGMTELERVTAEIKIICTEEYTSQMQNAIQNWQRVLGTAVVVKVVTLTEDDFKKAVKNKNFQIAVGTVEDTTSSAIDTLKKFTTDSKGNIFGYSSEEYDKLVERIITESSGEGILSDSLKAEKMLIDEAVFCPLHTCAETIAFGEDVTGLFMSPDFKGINFLNGGQK